MHIAVKALKKWLPCQREDKEPHKVGGRWPSLNYGFY
jgi:hypothetical protein